MPLPLPSFPLCSSGGQENNQEQEQKGSGICASLGLPSCLQVPDCLPALTGSGQEKEQEQEKEGVTRALLEAMQGKTMEEAEIQVKEGTHLNGGYFSHLAYSSPIAGLYPFRWSQWQYSASNLLPLQHCASAWASFTQPHFLTTDIAFH